MSKITVWLEDIAEAFEDTDASWQPYLDLKDGQIVFVPLTNELLEDYSEEEQMHFSEMPSLSNYLVLPNQKELKEFDIMQQYTEDTYNVGLKKRLLFALNKPKPFRNFRTQVRLLNLEEDYEHYRYMAFCAKARIWCKEHDIAFDIDGDEVKEYIHEIEEEEKLKQDLEDFDDTMDEFEYEEEYDEDDYYDED